MKLLITTFCFLFGTAAIFAQGKSAFTNGAVYYQEHTTFSSPQQISDLGAHGVTTANTLEKNYEHSDTKKNKHTKYSQYYRGLRVLGATKIYHSREGQLYATSGSIYDIKNISTKPTITKREGISTAKSHVIAQAHTRQDETIYKHKDLEVTEVKVAIADRHYPGKSGVYVLDHIYTVTADNGGIPLSMDVHIDAHSGEVITAISNIHEENIVGHGDGYYHQDISFNVDSISPTHYELHDATRGGGITAVDRSNNEKIFSDSDNVWGYDSDGENAAIDGYWAAIQYYDFLDEKMNRNSIDDDGTPLTLRMNENVFVNAYWNGGVATFGNGNCHQYNPLTTVEIVAHEFTHGLTQYTSGLVYRNESGALNEAMSDIFGKAVEYFYDNEHFNWYIGQALPRTDQQNPFRSMIDPNERYDAKYYQGKYWKSGRSDNGGVHSNSGVFNHWFYLLVEGGQGTNENEYNYNITGIGMEDAIKIAYLMQTSYLTELSGFAEARSYSIAAARDLFGMDSAIEDAVIEAWTAVGVDENTGLPLNLEISINDRTPYSSDYCIDEFNDMTLTVSPSFAQDSVPNLPSGTRIDGTVRISYNGYEEDIDLVLQYLPTPLNFGDEFLFNISHQIQDLPSSVRLISTFNFVTPAGVKYVYRIDNTMYISEITEPRLDIIEFVREDLCDNGAYFSFSYFEIEIPICVNHEGAVVQGIFTGDNGTEMYEMPVELAIGSTLYGFDALLAFVDLSKLGDIRNVVFSLVYKNGADLTILHEESLKRYFGVRLDDEVMYTFTNDDGPALYDLTFAPCRTCGFDIELGHLVFNEDSNVTTVEDCISTEEYYGAVTRGYSSTSSLNICVDLRNLTDPRLYFDLKQEDNVDFTSAENRYLHNLDVKVEDESLLQDLITSTDGEFQSFEIKLPAAHVSIEISILNQGSSTFIDNLGISDGMYSDVSDLHDLDILYNNPVSETLHLTIDDNITTGTSPTIATIYGIDGTLVYSQEINHNADIDMSALSSGLYLLKVTNGTDIHWTGKVVKM